MMKTLTLALLIGLGAAPAIAKEAPPTRRQCHQMLMPSYPSNAYTHKWLDYCIAQQDADGLALDRANAAADAAHATEGIDRELEYDDWCIRLRVDCY